MQNFEVRIESKNTTNQDINLYDTQKMLKYQEIK